MRAAARAWGAAVSHARRFSATAAAPPTQSKVGPLFFGTMVVTTLGLGTWQLSRHGWKKELIETRKADLEKGIADVTATPCVCIRPAAIDGLLHGAHHRPHLSPLRLSVQY